MTRLNARRRCFWRALFAVLDPFRPFIFLFVFSSSLSLITLFAARKRILTGFSNLASACVTVAFMFQTLYSPNILTKAFAPTCLQAHLKCAVSASVMCSYALQQR